EENGGEHEHAAGAGAQATPPAAPGRRRGLGNRRFGLGRRALHVVAHVITTSGVPASTDEPSATSTSRTTPSRPARSSFSIFIASTTITPCRAVTWSPGLTSSLTTLPGIGATTRSGVSPLLAARFALAPSGRSLAGTRRPPTSTSISAPSRPCAT